MRRTVLKAETKTDADEIRTSYRLSAGGRWAKAPMKVFDYKEKRYRRVEVAAYISERNLRADIASLRDYERTGSLGLATVSNEISTSIVDAWIVKRYGYRERYRESVFVAQSHRLLDAFLSKNASRVRLRIAGRIGDKGVTEIIIEALTRESDRIVDAIVNTRLAKEAGTIPPREAADTLSGLWSELLATWSGWDSESDVNEKFFYGELPELDVDEFRKEVVDALAGGDGEPEVDDTGDAGFAALSALCFGSHGFNPLQSYHFTVKLVMPGTVYATNARIRAGSLLAWRFDETELDGSLYAKSFVVYPGRIALLFAIVAFFVFLRRFGRSPLRMTGSKSAESDRSTTV